MQSNNRKKQQEVVEGAEDRCLRYIGTQNVARAEMPKNG